MSSEPPAYHLLLAAGTLAQRARRARRWLAACRLCPRRCGVDRLSGQRGYCRTASRARVASYGAHFGEEAPLVGHAGSGTIFFSHCNLGCRFCQNWEISHGGAGEEVDAHALADMMLELQSQGCHNINLVTPSHVVPQILDALVVAAQRGLRLPLVYNSGGYDRRWVLRWLSGVVDIYMPDFKFWDEDIAQRLCDARDYPHVARAALHEMHRQVGDLVLDGDGLAPRGLLVRHLVMPAGLAGTEQVLAFIARSLSVDTYVNLMPQYRPCGHAWQIPELAGGITHRDLFEALRAAHRAGLTRLDGIGRLPRTAET
jgi:putative pyruvate formate lyase activating enzyme